MTASSNNNCPEKYSSNAKHDRKLRKPLIEKRRRERINCSLEQLKGIMVDAYNLDQSKLEKADVLEVTVQHMEGLQKGLGAASVDSTTTNVAAAGFESRQRYSTGYIQCMHEVHNLLLSCPGMDKTLGAGLLNHLLKSLPHVSAADVASGAASPGSSPERGQRGDWSPNGQCGGNLAIGDRRHHHSGSPPHPGQLSYSYSSSSSSSPPSSPLSPETRSPFRPRRLEMHDPSAIMPQAARRQRCCPQSPAMLLPEAAGPAVTEGPTPSGEAKVCGVGDGSIFRPPVSSYSPCFSPPRRASTPASPVGPAPSQVEDASMWRPW